VNEELEKIAQDLRRKERELWAGNPPRMGNGAVALMLDGYASRLEVALGLAPRPKGEAAATEREMAEAEAEAAKDARNRALVRLREEYAERCHECKTKSGNAAAMRLCDELIQAAYDADICSPGDLAQRVRKIKDAIGPSQQGNAAALRDALLKARNTLMLYSRDMKPRYQAEVGFMIDDCDAALAAPPRNCDRFKAADEARMAFWDTHETIWDAFKNRGGTELFYEVLDWLFAKAKGGAEC
jgi:hypothetical protein